jgi:hypothetical protein
VRFTDPAARESTWTLESRGVTVTWRAVNTIEVSQSEGGGGGSGIPGGAGATGVFRLVRMLVVLVVVLVWGVRGLACLYCAAIGRDGVTLRPTGAADEDPVGVCHGTA